MKPTLLIADGDAEFCALYWLFLSKCGYEVETASDGLECLEKLQRAMPAVVLLDLELPRGGGDVVLAWLREERPVSGVGVILTTTTCQPLDFSEVIEPPVIAFLPKPFALTALLEKIRSAAAKGQEAAWKASQIPA
jgi:CheY-like chemotaxis protein